MFRKNEEGEAMEENELLSALQRKDEQALALCIQQYGGYAAGRCAGSWTRPAGAGCGGGSR